MLEQCRIKILVFSLPFVVMSIASIRAVPAILGLTSAGAPSCPAFPEDVDSADAAGCNTNTNWFKVYVSLL